MESFTIILSLLAIIFSAGSLMLSLHKFSKFDKNELDQLIKVYQKVTTAIVNIQLAEMKTELDVALKKMQSRIYEIDGLSDEEIGKPRCAGDTLKTYRGELTKISELKRRIKQLENHVNELRMQKYEFNCKHIIEKNERLNNMFDVNRLSINDEGKVLFDDEYFTGTVQFDKGKFKELKDFKFNR